MDCIALASITHTLRRHGAREWIALRLRVLHIQTTEAGRGRAYGSLLPLRLDQAAAQSRSLPQLSVQQRVNGLHCACEYYTHPAPPRGEGMDCIALASFTHPHNTRRQGSTKRFSPAPPVGPGRRAIQVAAASLCAATSKWIALRLRVLHTPCAATERGNGLHCACEFYT